MQDAFIAYLEKAPDFDGPEHEKAWLIRVTIVNGWQEPPSGPWRRTAPLLETYSSRHTRGGRAPGGGAGPAAQGARRRPPLLLRGGYRTAEIAAMTGEAEGTVRARLSGPGRS